MFRVPSIRLQSHLLHRIGNGRENQVAVLNRTGDVHSVHEHHIPRVAPSIGANLWSLRTKVVRASARRRSRPARARSHDSGRHAQCIPQVAVELWELPHSVRLQRRLNAAFIGVYRLVLFRYHRCRLAYRRHPQADVHAFAFCRVERQSHFLGLKSLGFGSHHVMARSQARKAIISRAASFRCALNARVYVAQINPRVRDRRAARIRQHSLNTAAVLRNAEIRT